LSGLDREDGSFGEERAKAGLARRCFWQAGLCAFRGWGARSCRRERASTLVWWQPQKRDRGKKPDFSERLGPTHGDWAAKLARAAWKQSN